MFKVNNKDTKTTSAFVVNFEHISHLCSRVSIVNFEQVNVGWVKGDKDGGVKGDDGWAVGMGQDENLGVHAYVTRNRSGRIDYGWNFNWEEWRDSVEKDRVFGEVISWIGSVDHVRSEFILSCEESTWDKGIGGGNLWNFNERDGELSNKKKTFSGWRMLLRLTVVVMKMIRKVFKLKEGFSWLRKMEVKI